MVKDRYNEKLYLDEMNIFKCVSENKISKPSYIYNFKDKMKEMLNKGKPEINKNKLIQKKGLQVEIL